MAGNRHDPHSEEHEVRQPDPNNPETLYEHRDVNTWAVGKFGIGLTLFTIAAIGLLIGVFKFFEAQEGGPRPAGELNVDARRLPPQPRLQQAPILDLQQMRAAEDQLLNGYGWVDQQKGIVRIPVARAMELLAQRPPAARTQAETPAVSDATVPTESGMGEIMQRPGGPLAGELSGASVAANEGQQGAAQATAPKEAEKK